MPNCLFIYNNQPVQGQTKLQEQVNIREFRQGHSLDTTVGETVSNSELFQNLASIPLLGEEDALNAYKYSLSERVATAFGQSNTSIDQLSAQENAVLKVSQTVEGNQTVYLTEEGNYTDNIEEAAYPIRPFIQDSEGNVQNIEKFFNRVDTNGEPKPVFRTNNSIFYNYKDALRKAHGSPIAVGLYTPVTSQYIPLYEVTSSVNPSTIEGAVNNGIVEGILHHEKVLSDNGYAYRGGGLTSVEQHLNAHSFAESLNTQKGAEIATVSDNSLISIEDSNPDVLDTIDGEYTPAELRDLLIKEGAENFKAMFGDEATQLAYMAIQSNDPILPNHEQDFVPAHETSPREDSELIEIVFDLLNSLGIKVVSISDYIENYNRRFGKDPDVNAIADIGRRVLALAETQNIDVTLVTEELAHFILEAFEDQQALLDLADEVRQTREWAEYNQEYYKKYSENYKGAELDNLVMKEILGKLLANRIIETQAEVDQSGTPQTLVERLFNIFTNFIDKIRSFFNPTVQSNLNNVLNEIAEKVLDKTIMDYIDEANLDKGELMMFSLEDRRAVVALRKAVDTLERQLIALTRSRDPQATGVRESVSKAKEAADESIRKSLTEEIVNANEWIAIRSVVASISSLVTPLRVKYTSDKDAIVTQQDLQILQEVNNYREVLAELKEAVKNSKYATSKQRDQLNKTIDGLIIEISDLNPQISTATASMLENHINKYIEVSNFTEEEQQQYRELFYQQQSDINWFSRYYGFLQHQNNVFLNSLGWLINKMHFNANKEYTNTITPFLDKIEKLKYGKQDYEKMIQKNADGTYSRFFRNPYDMAAYYKNLEQAQLDALNKALGTQMSLAQYNNALSKGKAKSVYDLTLSEQKVYEEFMSEWHLENTERRHTPEFYREQEEMWNREYIWEEADVSEGELQLRRGEAVTLSDDTRKRLQSINARRVEVLNKYRGEDGRVDYVKLSENIEDTTMMNLLKIERDELKSTFDSSTREMKTGLDLKVAKDIEFIDTQYQEKFSLPRDISEDYWAEARKVLQEAQDNIPDSDPLKSRKVNKAVMSFLMNNGGFTFSDAYWSERVEGTISYIDKVDRMLDFATSTPLEEALVQLKENLILRQEMTKKYRDRNDLTDVMFENITVVDLETFSTVEKNIQELSQRIKSIADSMDWVLPELEIDSETTLNNAYSRALRNSNKEEFSFLKEHMTADDASRMDRFRAAIEEFKISGQLPTFVQKFLIREFGLKDASTVHDFLSMTDIAPETLAVAYGRKKVFSYFKRNAPAGYTSFMSSIDAGVMDMGHLIDELEYSHKGLRTEDGTVLDHIRARPNYQWFEETVDDKLNPNFQKNFEGGRYQPRIDKYLDQSTFDRYGASVEHFLNTGEFVPTRNKEEYGVLEDIYELMSYSLDKYNESANGNIYQLPQFSKSSLERTGDTLKGKGFTTFLNSIKDLMKNRVDDLGYGEKDGDKDIRDFSSVRVIPKYGLRLLEEQSDISHEITYSLGRMVQLATLYEARQEIESEAKMMEQKVQEKTNVRKSGATSRASEMAKDFIDYYLYGIGRTQKIEVSLGEHKIDITKIAMAFERYVRKVNLGFNPAIAATAYTTSEAWLNMEGNLHEYMGPGSLRWANAELPKLLPEFFANMGKISNQSKIKLLQERFLVADLADRTKRSGYNRILRMTGDMSFKMLEATDIPILNRMMLSLMKDHRVVGNRIMNYNEFAKRAKQDGKTKAEITAEWKAIEKQSVYELMEIRDGKAVPIEATKDMFEGMPEDYFERKLDQIGMKLNSVHSFVDGRMSNMDRVAASRNLMVFTIAHRSWALITMARLFKSEHFNPLTGQYEKGHVRSFGTYFKNLFGELNAKTYDNLITAIKEEWHTLDDLDKTNIQRMLMHTGVLFSLLLIGIAVAKAADDDDNKDDWALQFSAYVYFRTMNELSTQHFPLGLGETVQMAKTPFMALQNIEEFINPKNYNFEPVQSGPYKGLPRAYRHLAKQTFLRHYYDMGNIAQKSQFYRVNNSANLLWLGK